MHFHLSRCIKRLVNCGSKTTCTNLSRGNADLHSSIFNVSQFHCTLSVYCHSWSLQLDRHWQTDRKKETQAEIEKEQPGEMLMDLSERQQEKEKELFWCLSKGFDTCLLQWAERPWQNTCMQANKERGRERERQWESTYSHFSYSQRWGHTHRWRKQIFCLNEADSAYAIKEYNHIMQQL